MSRLAGPIVPAAVPDGCPDCPSVDPSALSTAQLTDAARDSLTAQSVTLRAVLDAVVTPLSEAITAQGSVLDKVTSRLERVMRECCQRQANALISIANDLRAIVSGRVASDGSQLRIVRDLLPQVGDGPEQPGQQPAFPGPPPPLPAPIPQGGGPGAVVPVIIAPDGQQEAQQPQEQPQQEEEQPLGACGIGLGERAQRPDNVVAIVPWGRRQGKQAAFVSDCGTREFHESAAKAEPVGPLAEFLEAGDMMAVLSKSISRNGKGLAGPEQEDFTPSTAPLRGF